jgi:hypothetical protein
VRTAGQILFDTVRRFKGQQAPAAVLVDLNPRERRTREELQVPVFGMTTAMVRLEVVASVKNSGVIG